MRQLTLRHSGWRSWVQADPAVLSRQPALLREFEAAPWLLPPRTPALPYAGVHDFDQLLALRSAPVGNYSKAIALLLFSKAYGLMAQNSGECAAAVAAHTGRCSASLV